MTSHFAQGEIFKCKKSSIILILCSVMSDHVRSVCQKSILIYCIAPFNISSHILRNRVTLIFRIVSERLAHQLFNFVSRRNGNGAVGPWWRARRAFSLRDWSFNLASLPSHVIGYACVASATRRATE